MSDPVLDAAKLLNAYLVAPACQTPAGESAKAQCLLQRLLGFDVLTLRELYRLRWQTATDERQHALATMIVNRARRERRNRFGKRVAAAVEDEQEGRAAMHKIPKPSLRKGVSGPDRG